MWIFAKKIDYCRVVLSLFLRPKVSQKFKHKFLYSVNGWNFFFTYFHFRRASFGHSSSWFLPLGHLLILLIVLIYLRKYDVLSELGHRHLCMWLSRLTKIYFGMLTHSIDRPEKGRGTYHNNKKKVYTVIQPWLKQNTAFLILPFQFIYNNSKTAIALS